jgi:CDP-diacylglycerol--serine O-phosphatidyltransferase
LTNFWALAMITILLSALMVADIKLLALKFKGFQWNRNMMRYLLIMASVLLIIWLKLAALPLIIIFYVILSMSNNYLEKSV